MNAVIKPKKCRVCRREFAPRLSTQVCCSPTCAISYARHCGEKRQSAAMKRVAAAEKRERRIALKTRKDWVREAQAAFNAWVRERDHFQPCISCGSHVPDGYWDAGHFLSVGAHPELRFEPLNCHKQCKSCNGTTIHKRGYVQPFERQLSVRNRYRANLVERIGLRQVEWLESYHEPLKPTVEWLREKIVEWRKETRRMREARGARQVA